MNINSLAFSSAAAQFLDDCLTPEFTLNGEKFFLRIRLRIDSSLINKFFAKVGS